MDPTQLREQLGLPESASDEEVLERISELRAADTQAEGDGDEETPPERKTGEPASDDEGKQVQTEEEVEDPPAQDEQAQTPEKIAASLNLPEGVQLVDAATLQELREAAQRGQSAWQRQQEEERERILASAVDEGKIAVAQVDSYRTRWEADPDMTRDLIVNHLASGLVPMDERGHDNEPDRQVDDVKPFLLFPEKDQARS